MDSPARAYSRRAAIAADRSASSTTVPSSKSSVTSRCTSTMRSGPLSHDASPQPSIDHLRRSCRTGSDQPRPTLTAVVVHAPARDDPPIQLEEVAQPSRVSPPDDLVTYAVAAQLHAPS